MIPIKFKMSDTYVDITGEANESKRIYFIRDTGIIISRKYDHPIIGLFAKHKGLIIGVDAWRNLMILHATKETKGPSVVYERDFTKGFPFTFDSWHCDSDGRIKIKRALSYAISADSRPFNPAVASCLTLVAKSCSPSMMRRRGRI